MEASQVMEVLFAQVWAGLLQVSQFVLRDPDVSQPYQSFSKYDRASLRSFLLWIWDWSQLKAIRFSLMSGVRFV